MLMRLIVAISLNSPLNVYKVSIEIDRRQSCDITTTCDLCFLYSCWHFIFQFTSIHNQNRTPFYTCIQNAQFIENNWFSYGSIELKNQFHFIFIFFYMYLRVWVFRFPLLKTDFCFFLLSTIFYFTLRFSIEFCQSVHSRSRLAFGQQRSDKKIHRNE